MSSLEEQIRWHVVTDSSYSSPVGYVADRSPDPQSKMLIYVVQNYVFPPRKGSLCGLELMKSASYLLWAMLGWTKPLFCAFLKKE